MKDFKLRLIFDRTHIATSTVKAPVEIEAYQDGYRRRWRSGVLVLKHQWNGMAVVRHPKAADLNRKILDRQRDIYDAISAADGDVRLAALEGSRNASAESPVGWMRRVLAKRTDLRAPTANRHRLVLDTVEKAKLFCKWKNVTVSEVRRFDEWLSSRPGRGALGNSISTQSKYTYHKVLKSYFSKAVAEDLLHRNPYDAAKISRGKSRDRDFLTEEERTTIEGLTLTGGEALARDMFLFACYTGLSVSDIRALTKESFTREGEAVYLTSHRIKTGSRFRVRMLPAALALLEKHNYNLNLVADQVANRYLKVIAAKAQINKRVTMHVGRHTFATWALSRGVPIETVSKMLGHSSVTITEIYAKVLQKSVDEAFNKLL